jgi:hypothetical protein
MVGAIRIVPATALAFTPSSAAVIVTGRCGSTVVSATCATPAPIVSGIVFVHETAIFGVPRTGNFRARYTHIRDVGTGTNVRRERRVRPGTGVNGISATVETATRRFFAGFRVKF